MTRAVFFALLVSLVTARADAQVRAVAPMLPILVTTTDGQKADGGQAVVIVREAARRAGVSIDIEVQPWSRAFTTASRTADVLLFPVTRTPERESQFEWIGPVNRVEYWVFRVANGKATEGKTLKDIAAGSFGMLQNDATETYVRTQIPAASIEGVAVYGNLVPMLLRGRFEYLIAQRTSLLAELDRLGVPRSVVQGLFPIRGALSDDKSYLVIGKNSDPALVKALRTAMAAMVADGGWNAIFAMHQ